MSAHPPASNRFLLAALLALASFALDPLAFAAEPRSAPAAQPAAETYALFKDGRRVPLFNQQYDSTPVAKVGTDVVTLGDLTDALATVHQERGESKAGGKDFGVVLDRLIDVHVVVLEAESMGITELPEYKTAVEAATEKAAREALRRDVGASARADPRDVDRALRANLREWKVRSVLFEKEEDAKRFDASLRSGGSFEALAAHAVADGKAKGGGQPEFVRATSLAPPVHEALRKLAVGAASRPIKIAGGWTVVQVLGQRQGDDPQERAKVEAGMSAAARLDALRAFYLQLVKKYAQVDRKLLRKLDLEAEKPGLDALERDPRALARIEGEKPISVGELVIELRRKFFHGAERQAKERKLNAKKETTFDDMLEKRLFVKEARARKLQERDDVRREVTEYADQLALSAAIERAVVPEVKVAEEDVRKYYEANKGELTTPAMAKLEGLAFEKPADAQEAFRKLRAGTDFKWLAANAERQLDPAKSTLHLEGNTFMWNDLPEGLSDALAGAKTGDYRLYGAGSGQYVIHVIELFPSAIQPFEAVKEALSKRVYGEKLNQAFKAWTSALRKQYPVEILIARLGD
jgi:parvulin-like peptidyl-prolyl isomerase